MVALRTCQRYGCTPADARALLGLRSLHPRRLAAWTAALSHVAALEEAEDAITTKDGKPTIEQRIMMRDVELDYVKREGFEMVVEQSDGPVLTPTDEGYVAPDVFDAADGGEA